MKSRSEFDTITFSNKRKSGEVCDGSVQSEIKIDLPACEDNYSDDSINQDGNSDSSDSEFVDDKRTEFEKNYELRDDIRIWAINEATLQNDQYKM